MINLKDINKYIRGFSLIEIMVAVGLASGISLGVMKITQTTAKSVKKNQQDFEISLLMSTVSSSLKDENSCSLNFNSNYLANEEYAADGINSTDSAPLLSK